jgi:hypothetical protein
VVVRGAVTLSPRRTSAENVYFDLDDGSGPIRIFVSPGADVATEAVLLGSWVDLTGVLGQETTGKLPERGYRIWPRSATDLRIVAGAAAGAGENDGDPAPTGSAAGGPGAGSAGSPASAAPAAQQGVPKLRHAVSTAAPTTTAPGTPPTPRPAVGASTQPAAAGLLALAGLTIGGGGIAFGGRGLIARMRSAIAGQEVDVPPAEGGDEGRPAAPESLPRLVPLTVLEGSQGPEHRNMARVPDGQHADGGRILPPT